MPTAYLTPKLIPLAMAFHLYATHTSVTLNSPPRSSHRDRSASVTSPSTSFKASKASLTQIAVQRGMPGHCATWPLTQRRYIVAFEVGGLSNRPGSFSQAASERGTPASLTNVVTRDELVQSMGAGVAATTAKRSSRVRRSFVCMMMIEVAEEQCDVVEMNGFGDDEKLQGFRQ